MIARRSVHPPTGSAVRVLVLLLALGLAGCAGPGQVPDPATPPAAPDAPQATTSTLSEWLSGVVGCLNRQGWSARITADHSGIADVDLPPSRQAAYQAASETCERAAGPPPNDVPMTADHARAIYRALVAVRSCLAAHGYPTAKPPAQESFVQDYVSGRAPWSPYLEVPSQVQGQAWVDLNRVCPQPA